MLCVVIVWFVKRREKVQQDRQTSVLSPREPTIGANLGLVGTLQGAFLRQKCYIYIYKQY